MGKPMNDCEKSKCDAASALVQSIAAEENAIAQILAAESEKLRKIICMEHCSSDELLAANNSVANMVEKLTALEMVLKSKLDLILPILEDCCECCPCHNMMCEE